MAAKWPAEKRARCIGALWASAIERDGEWYPHLAMVAETEGVAVTTLFRWWQERDRTQDGKFRDAAQRARTEAAVSGARAWFDEILRLGQARVKDLLTEQRHEGADVDASARATKGAIEAGLLVAGHLGLTGEPDPGDGDGGATVVEVRVRGALDRITRG